MADYKHDFHTPKAGHETLLTEVNTAIAMTTGRQFAPKSGLAGHDIRAALTSFLVSQVLDKSGDRIDADREAVVRIVAKHADEATLAVHQIGDRMIESIDSPSE